jgi:DNA-binding transcriptional LysR family regulator
MDTLGAIRVFSRVVEAGSFSAVARELGTTQPTVSKQIAMLEEHLGTRLVNRTTRNLTLTEDGKTYYECCRHILNAVEEADGAVGRRQATPSGLIRAGCPVAFGRLHVAPRMRRFLDRYPELRVELVMSDQFGDLVEQGVDVTIRIGDLADASLIARLVGVTRRVTIGSPEYFARMGEPRTPHDLVRHNCLVYTRLSTGNEWHFNGPSGLIKVRVAGTFLADNSEAIRAAVIAGVGIGVAPIWSLYDEIARGEVRIVLADYEPKRLPIHALYPSRRFVSSKVRAFIDFLADEFGCDPLIAVADHGDAT